MSLEGKTFPRGGSRPPCTGTRNFAVFCVMFVAQEWLFWTTLVLESYSDELTYTLSAGAKKMAPERLSTFHRFPSNITHATIARCICHITLYVLEILQCSDMYMYGLYFPSRAQRQARLPISLGIPRPFSRVKWVRTNAKSHTHTRDVVQGFSGSLDPPPLKLKFSSMDCLYHVPGYSTLSFL